MRKIRLVRWGFVVALSLAPLGAAAESDSGFDLLETRFSHVGMPGSTRPDIERLYDPEGGIKKIIYHDSPAHGMTESLSYEGLRRVRRFERGKVLVREEIEEFNDAERLVSRTISWKSSDAGPIDRRSIEKFPGFDIEKSDFELVKGQWSLREHTVSEGLLFGTGTDQYVACLKKAGQVDAGKPAEAACRKQLTDILDLSTTNYATYTNLACKDDVGQQLFLPQGFRIDLESCHDPDDPGDTYVVDRLKSGIDALMGNIKCLFGLNSEVGKKLLKAIAENRPRINCLNGFEMTEGGPLHKRLCSGLKTEACVAKITKLNDPKTGGFFNSGAPSDVFLTQSDPKTGLSRMKTEARTAADKRADDERIWDPTRRDALYREELAKKKKSALGGSSGSLAETMLHEFLHLAGIPHNEKVVDCGGKKAMVHNCYVGKAYLQDPVYGCSAMCGGDWGVSYWSKEGCESCVKYAPPGAKSKGDVAKCATKPKASWEQ